MNTVNFSPLAGESRLVPVSFFLILHCTLPLLDFIEWKETKDHNVEVLNQTIHFYRYYDLTLHAEFLYECVDETIEKIIPAEIDYLSRYDQFKNYVKEEFEMPDKLVSTLVRFLEQNLGKLSKRAREK